MVDAWDQFPDAPDPKAAASDPWAQFPDHPSMSWGQVGSQAIQNLPSSAYNVGAGIVNAVAHPIDTAEGIYNLGKGAVSKAAGALGVEQDPQQKAQDEAGINALKDFYVNRYGSMDGFKKALAEDPAGVAMDLSAVFSGPELALSRAPGMLGKVGEMSGRIADATNPISLAGKLAANVAEPVVSNVLGQTTGVGAQPIRQAARAGAEGNTTLLDNMRGAAPMSDTVDMAQSALGQMRKDRSAAYQANMAAVNADPGHVGYQPIYKALKDAEDMVQYQGLDKSDSAANVLEQINKKVSQWRSLPNPYTVEGADALKQAIGEIRQSTKPGTLDRKVADGVYNAAKSSIIQQAPDYAAAMADYSNASDKIDELTKTFSLGEKASQDTQLRKLQSVMRNNVNTNYGQRGKLMNELARYEPDLPNALAGQTLSSSTPRGLAGLGAITVGGGGVAMHGLPALINPATLAMLPAFSPRLVGEGAYAAGQVGNALMPIAQYIPDAVKAGYVLNMPMNALAQQQGLRGGIGPRYDENGNLRPGQ